MDFLPDIDSLSEWLIKYGAFAIFILLMLGIIAVPVPEETLMVISGLLMKTGKLNITHTIIAAYLGSVCGITGSYLIGRTVGIYFIHKYGSWLGLTEERLKTAHVWFEKYGKWSLVVGYFIPGVRHFTGIVAGATTLSYREFALYAYTGAFFWVSTFLSLGYFFGKYWEKVFEIIDFDTGVTIGVSLVVVLLAVYLIKRKKKVPNV